MEKELLDLIFILFNNQKKYLHFISLLLATCIHCNKKVKILEYIVLSTLHTKLYIYKYI